MRSSYVLSTLLMVCLTNDTATAQYFRGSRGSPVWRFQTFASPKIQMHPGVPLQMHSGSSFQMHGGSPFLMHPGSPVQMYAGTPLAASGVGPPEAYSSSPSSTRRFTISSTE